MRADAESSCTESCTQLGARIVTEVSQSRTSLTDIYGIGPLTAAEIITETGDPCRYRTKARFAMANGTAPIEASSGRVVRHRSNRGGNRQLNKALHIAAIAQIRSPDTEGHAYYQRCLCPGGARFGSKTCSAASMASAIRVSTTTVRPAGLDCAHPHCPGVPSWCGSRDPRHPPHTRWLYESLGFSTDTSECWLWP